MDHAFKCYKGGKCIRLHDNVVQVIAAWLRRAGAYCGIEQMAPELYTTDEDGDIKEARLDKVARWPGDTMDYKLDVTIRSLTAKYSEHICPGLAADKGEKEKFRRYGDNVIHRGRWIPWAACKEVHRGGAGQGKTMA